VAVSSGDEKKMIGEKEGVKEVTMCVCVKYCNTHYKTVQVWVYIVLEMVRRVWRIGFL
jgi:hypothetical protein